MSKTYEELLHHVFQWGEWEEQRATVEGKPVRTRSLFAPPPIKYDLEKGFPLITSKKVPLNLVEAELRWFISGSNNIEDLHKNNCHIWDEWANEEGFIYPSYGQTMQFGIQLNQIAKCLNEIHDAEKWDHPAGRRLVLSNWQFDKHWLLSPHNPMTCKTPVGCHTLAQWKLRRHNEKHLTTLDCHVYMRSCDLFLGLPFNLASYALLTRWLAKYINHDPFHLPCVGGVVTFSFGDAHFYENHLQQVETLLQRDPRPLPTLSLTSNTMKHVVPFDYWLLNYNVQTELDGYEPLPTIKAIIAV